MDKGIKLGRAVAALAAGALGGDEEVGTVLELSIEVAAVEALAGDGLGEGVQFAEGKVFGEEFGAEDRGLVESSAEVGEGLAQQQGMVEGEGGEEAVGGEIEPPDCGG